METRNPYTAPKAEVAGKANDAYGGIKPFSSRGRMGRLRYIGYSVGLTMLIGFAMGIAGGFLGNVAGPEIGMIVIFAAYAAIFVVVILLTIQRAHDFNASGWMALLLVVPLVNLIFWFIPGTDGENRFGLRPPPNSTGVVILALVFPIIFIVGIVAAIAIPAYQQYVNRAATTQSQ